MYSITCYIVALYRCIGSTKPKIDLSCSGNDLNTNSYNQTVERNKSFQYLGKTKQQSPRVHQSTQSSKTFSLGRYLCVLKQAYMHKRFILNLHIGCTSNEYHNLDWWLPVSESLNTTWVTCRERGRQILLRRNLDGSSSNVMSSTILQNHCCIITFYSWSTRIWSGIH